MDSDQGATPQPDEQRDGSGSDSDTAAETEPDYRFTLANERTFLAWQRTSLGLVAGGVALEEFARLSLPNGLTHVIALGAVTLGAVLAVLGLVNWTRTQRAMRQGRPLPISRAIPVLAIGLALAAVLIGVGLVLT